LDLTILNTANQPIPSHAYAAFAAVLVGGFQFVRPKGTRFHKSLGYVWVSLKGTRFHKSLGYVWVSLMLWVCVSSFWIQTLKIIGPFSPIHFLSLFTIWSVFEAIKSARKGNIIRHQRMMKLMYILALVITGLFTLSSGRTMNEVFFSG